jgi:hypothetical protein
LSASALIICCDNLARDLGALVDPRSLSERHSHAVGMAMTMPWRFLFFSIFFRRAL